MLEKNNTKPKLAIIGTVGVPAQYGGFETLVEQLLKYIEDDFEITVYCSAKFYKKENRKSHYGKAKLVYLPLQANGIWSIPYDMISIIHAAFKSDLLLILGVSGCLLLPFIKFFNKKRFFVNIDGIEWKRDKWNSFIKTFLRYSEIFSVESAEAIITDNQVIKDYLKTTYNYDSYLIEYGGDQAVYQGITKEAIQKYTFIQAPYAFSVCRIEPENNIHIILETMASQTYLPLVLVGNWNHSEYGKKLKSTYENLEHIHLLDPIYDPKSLNVLRANCYVYLHGHSAGGTNPSIVEAMNLALPIIAFDVGYNRESTEGEALYFKTKKDLLECLSQVNEDTKLKLSQRMLAIAKRRYTWQIIAEKYRRMMMPIRVRSRKAGVGS